MFHDLLVYAPDISASKKCAPVGAQNIGSWLQYRCLRCPPYILFRNMTHRNLLLFLLSTPVLPKLYPGCTLSVAVHSSRRFMVMIRAW